MTAAVNEVNIAFDPSYTFVWVNILLLTSIKKKSQYLHLRITQILFWCRFFNSGAEDEDRRRSPLLIQITARTFILVLG